MRYMSQMGTSYMWYWYYLRTISPDGERKMRAVQRYFAIPEPIEENSLYLETKIINDTAPDYSTDMRLLRRVQREGQKCLLIITGTATVFRRRTTPTGNVLDDQRP